MVICKLINIKWLKVYNYPAVFWGISEEEDDVNSLNGTSKGVDGNEKESILFQKCIVEP